MVSVGEDAPYLSRYLSPRIDRVLRQVYFKAVQRRPWIGFSSGAGYSSTSGDVEGIFNWYSSEHQSVERRLIFKWRSDACKSEAFRLHLTGDLVVSDASCRRLWEATLRSENGWEDSGRQLADALDRLEARVEDFRIAVEEVLPILPSIYDHPVSKAFPDPANFTEILEWARQLLRTDREDEAKALLPMVAAIRPAEADPKLLEFGRRARMLLANFRFVNCGIYMDPRWYARLWVDALACASESLRRNPRDLSAWADRASLRLWLWDLEGATEDCTQALCLDQHDSEVYCLRASVRKQLNEWEAALRDYTKSIELRESPGARFGRAQLFFWIAKGNPSLKRELLQKSVEDMNRIPSSVEDRKDWPWLYRRLWDDLQKEL